MSSVWKLWTIFGVLLLVVWVESAKSEDAPIPQPSSSPEILNNNPKIKKVRGEKEAEGTEAADRFEANTVIKSKYSLNGELLEVDPD